jgi:hypothetical protein
MSYEFGMWWRAHTLVPVVVEESEDVEDEDEDALDWIHGGGTTPFAVHYSQ